MSNDRDDGDEEAPRPSAQDERLATAVASAEASAYLLARRIYPAIEFADAFRRARRARRARLAFLILLTLFGVAALAGALGVGAYIAAAQTGAEIQVTDGLQTYLLVAAAIAAGAFFALAIAITICVLWRGFSRDYPDLVRITDLMDDARKRRKSYRGGNITALEEAIRVEFHDLIFEEEYDQEKIYREMSFTQLGRSIRARLIECIAEHKESQRLHLFLGIVGGALGVVALFWLGEDAIRLIRQAKLPTEQMWGLLATRGAAGFAAQGLWLFFLWSYRRAIAEGKYLQNELTTIESKIMGIQALDELEVLNTLTERGERAEFNEAQMRIVSMLMNGFLFNERHLILKKGEHTIYDQQVREDRFGIMNVFGRRTERGMPPGSPSPAGA